MKDLIPYNEALELKQLGFDEFCFIKYWINNEGLANTKWYWNHNGGMKLSAPTFSQAFRWFREKHDLQYWMHDGGYLGKCFIKITGYKHDKFYFSSSEPMEYEEAELACLRKLIEIAKTKKP
jgi:hypothetical protein